MYIEHTHVYCKIVKYFRKIHEGINIPTFIYNIYIHVWLTYYVCYGICTHIIFVYNNYFYTQRMHRGTVYSLISAYYLTLKNYY